MYCNGQGTPQHVLKGAQWFTRASKSGGDMAQQATKAIEHLKKVNSKGLNPLRSLGYHLLYYYHSSLNMALWERRRELLGLSYNGYYHFIKLFLFLIVVHTQSLIKRAAPLVCCIIEKAVSMESMQRADAVLKKERDSKRAKREARKKERETEKEKTEEKRRRQREAKREAVLAAEHKATLQLQNAGMEQENMLDDSWLVAEFGDEAEGKSGKGKKAKGKQKKGNKQMNSGEKGKKEDESEIPIHTATASITCTA